MGFDISDFMTGLLDQGPTPERAAPEPAAVPAAAPSDARGDGGPGASMESGDPRAPADIAKNGGEAAEQRALFSDSPQCGRFANWTLAPDTRGRVGLQAPTSRYRSPRGKT